MELNETKIVGHLVRDPEVRHTSNGQSVAEVTLGVNESYSAADKERKQIVTFVDVTVWGPSAENLAKLAQKGVQIFVQGSLRQSQWDDKQTGAKRSKLFVNAESWQFTQKLRASSPPEKIKGQEADR